MESDNAEQLQDEIDNIVLQALATMPDSFDIPYPPKLEDAAKRAVFKEEFVEHNQIVHLLKQINTASRRVKAKQQKTSHSYSEKVRINKARQEAVSRSAFYLWKNTYHHPSPTGQGGLHSNANFKRWATTHMRELQQRMLSYSEDQPWREQILTYPAGQWVVVQTEQ